MRIICALLEAVRLAARSAMSSPFRYAGGIIARFIDMVMELRGGRATVSMPWRQRAGCGLRRIPCSRRPRMFRRPMPRKGRSATGHRCGPLARRCERGFVRIRPACRYHFRRVSRLRHHAVAILNAMRWHADVPGRRRIGGTRHRIGVVVIGGAAMMRNDVDPGIVRAAAEVHAIALIGISDDGFLDEAADIESRSRGRHHQRCHQQGRRRQS